jgi:hypothetical protein
MTPQRALPLPLTHARHAYHRHGAFHATPGSTLRALRHMLSVPGPQNAGSDCVANCSASGKYAFSPPWRSADANNRRPSGEENATHVEGRARR